MRKKMVWIVLLAAVAAGWGISYLPKPVQTAAIVPASVERVGTLVLDAGHGGEDGGAVSVTGVPESQINLAIVQRMDSILGLYGVAPVVLRNEDISLHDSGASTLREKKVSDLHNRVEMVEAETNPTLISIHQNSYPQGQYHGAQVFYAPTDGSQVLAEHMQQGLRDALQPENSRQAKQIPETVYLMNHITCRAVLVECGFLTNPEEEALLRSSDYQTKLAAVLVAAFLSQPGETAVSG